MRSQTNREIKNATISEFSTFLKSSKSWEQFLLRLTFLPYLRLTVKIFQFLRLSTKFLAVLRLSVNPIETLLYCLLLTKTFPGFRSRWAISFACRNGRLSATSRAPLENMQILTFLSSPLFLHVLISSYPKSSVKYPLSNKRVSMGLIDRRKTAKNLADSRKN